MTAGALEMNDKTIGIASFIALVGGFSLYRRRRSKWKGLIHLNNLPSELTEDGDSQYVGLPVEESELWEEVGELYATKNQLFEVIGTDECSMCNEKLDYSMYGLAYKKFKPNLNDKSPVICGECFDSLTPDDWQPINRFGHKGMQNMKKNPKINVVRYVEDVGCRCPRCQWNIKFAQLLRDGKLVDGELPPNWEAKIGKSLPKVWIEDYEKDYPDLTYRDTKKGNFTANDWDWMLFYRCASCNEKHYIEGDEKMIFMARHYEPQTGRKYVYYEKPSGICAFCEDKVIE